MTAPAPVPASDAARGALTDAVSGAITNAVTKPVTNAVADAVTGAVTVAQALAAALAQGLDRPDAHRLLGHVLGRPRSWLIAHDTDTIATDLASRYQALCHQAADAVPLAYLLGEQDFHGLTLQVNPSVLVPRPDTETLVDWALAVLPGLRRAGLDRPQVLDLGTGSGAVALAVAHHWPAAELTATDLSAEALALAQANAQRLGLALHTRLGPWWQAVPPTARFALVLSNPPYIAGDDPHLPALRHEPLSALTPGGDGLDALRAIVAGAPAHLQPGGWLLLEHGWDQADAVRALLQCAGFTAVQTRPDLAGRPRCTGGQWPGAPGR